MLSKEAAHKATGMKVSEIVDIEPIEGGYRVHTHDGQHIDLDVVEEESAEPEPGEPPADEVPDGSADEVLIWVGDDKERASWALDVERQRPSPRSTLVAKLEKLVG